MASVFTFDPDPPRVSSPWSTPGTGTPSLRKVGSGSLRGDDQHDGPPASSDAGFLEASGISKLDPEPQDGPTEYKLHLLLRTRRSFTSLTSGNLVSGSLHSKVNEGGTSEQSQDPNESKQAQASSSQSRQTRLHQLTTQLLWRLQQSSPFHSSSTVNLVLPVFPDAAPTLDAPKALSPLLPGLEESQGALYEIGVSDDGTFVGLVEDELNESLTNLEAMAASLGCKVEVLRRVAVGYCNWEDKTSSVISPVTRTEKLWVAEALVSPALNYDEPQKSVDQRPSSGQIDQASELHQGNSQAAEQLHIAIAGASGAGKSSLLGILSTSALDNGRGKSRLSLLRHRHEIASGVTSSVAQELVGYSSDSSTLAKSTPDVINYATGNVASWNDIHAGAGAGGRVLFLSDLPGSLKYVKSTLRGLVSLKPHYVLLCIPASNPEEPGQTESTEVGMSLAYLQLCVSLGIPIIVVVTKLDAATRSSMRLVLSQVLSAVKASGRKPVMLPVPVETDGSDVDFQHISAAERQDANSAIGSIGEESLDGVPIVITSAVSGAGIGKLHALLRSLPIPSTVHVGEALKRPGLDDNSRERAEKAFDVNEVFEMPLSKVYSLSNEARRQNDRGIVLCGRVRRGVLSVGDRLVIGPFPPHTPELDGPNGNSAGQPRANYSRSLPDSLPSTRFRNLHNGSLALESQSIWQEVRVVSVRNLRLPVKALFDGQFGTIGIDPVNNSACLGRIRKGMLLANFHVDPPTSTSFASSMPRPLSPPYFHTGFIAIFPASDFLPTSNPPLVSGGNAVIYLGSIRASAKVSLVETVDHKRRPSPSATEPEIFTLEPNAETDADDDMFFSSPLPEAEDHVDSAHNANGDGVGAQTGEHIRISFTFVASVEWVEVGSQVIAMPGSNIATPSASSAALPSLSRSSYGLNGLVGVVCEAI